MTFKHSALLFCVLFSFVLSAQKKPLDHSVYDDWQSVTNRKITNDGKWVAFNIDRQEGDSELYLSSVSSAHKKKFDRGSKLAFTGDSRFAAFMVKPFYKDIKAVKDKKLKKDKLTKDSLAIVNLTDLSVQKIPAVQSFQIPEKNGSFIAYLLEDPNDKKPDDKDGDDEKKDDDKNASPAVLVLMNLENGQKTTFENVVKYKFSPNGKTLAFVTQLPEPKKDTKEKGINKSLPVKYTLSTVCYVDVSTGKTEKLTEAEGEFSQLSLDEAGTRLAFVGTSSARNDLVKEYGLYYFKPDKKSGQTAVINNAHSKLPKGWVLSENRLPVFSKNGRQLYFGIAPKPVAKDTTLITNDHAIVDIWNYRDDELQTIQLKNLKNDLKKSFAAVLKTDDPQNFRILQNEKTDTIRLVRDGDAPFVLGISSEDKDRAQWEGFSRKTYFTVDNTSEKKTVIVKGLNGSLQVSPLGKYAVYFDRDKGVWYSYDLAKKTTRPLNENLNVRFTDEEFDMPDQPRPYGIAAWTDNDESVLIRDRYDLWEFFLSGSEKPRNITKGFGRENRLTFDTYDFDPEIKSLSRKKPVLLSAFNNNTKGSGFYRAVIQSDRRPEEIYTGDFWGARTLVKAKNADVYLYTKETYQQSPDLFVTEDFKDQKQLSDTNPQQKNYFWGTSELVHWQTPKGYSSEGILYKPENFDPAKKYPMIVYFYEKLSDGLNRYVAPAPTPSRLNISYFVSNGYLVFTPDISYEDGHPGRSAVEYINSGVEYLKQNPWVDGEKIGIQGQSWGGYQVTYLITQNDMYAAAWAGAPVANMTSAYGGIRWSTGMNRQFQYEKSQSRIGKNLWEARDLYIENSPIFFFDKVNTPVAIMHNDRDGAVPWYQGIEMFTALKRLGKPVWLLNYNGDDHNLMKRQNRKDIQIREQQFFDHYLKGAKAPEWMTKGVPAIMKGKNWGFELTDENP